MEVLKRGDKCKRLPFPGWPRSRPCSAAPPSRRSPWPQLDIRLRSRQPSVRPSRARRRADHHRRADGLVRVCGGLPGRSGQVEPHRRGPASPTRVAAVDRVDLEGRGRDAARGDQVRRPEQGLLPGGERLPVAGDYYTSTSDSAPHFALALIYNCTSLRPTSAVPVPKGTYGLTSDRCLAPAPALRRSRRGQRRLAAGRGGRRSRPGTARSGTLDNVTCRRRRRRFSPGGWGRVRHAGICVPDGS